MSDINYTGELPSFEYWSDISQADYESLLSEFNESEWSFKNEAIKYCKLDCKCLFDVLVKFNELVFNKFNVNIHSALTLPSLAMRIYKSHYMPKDSIYQILGNVERDIRESYTGGAVDVYLPHNGVHQDFFADARHKLYLYDVNSLYPFVMSSVPMPIGKPIAFEGDIRDVDPGAYGFFYCKITSPNNLKHPILQRRIKTADGIRTIAGLGSWEGWVFSMEMDNAIGFGYQFEILKGYMFNKGLIFKDYVEKMYSLRMEYTKEDPMNLIAKLLMNSLYGKFGMKSDSSVVEIFDTDDTEDMQLLQTSLDTIGESIQNHVKLDNHVLIARRNVPNYKYDEFNDLYHGIDVNIPIASAVTSCGRMWMSQVKNNPKFKLYYSDTDSAVTNVPLPDAMIGTALGKFKLEYEIERAVFLAPKVYGIITTAGKEIIKVKGVTKNALQNVHIKDLENLLYKDAKMVFNQEKWFKNIFAGNINVADMAYQLQVTTNKRAPIYHSYSNYFETESFEIFNDTRPYFYSEIEK